MRRVARADPRQGQRQRNRAAVAIAPDDLQRTKERFGFPATAQGFEPCSGLGMALRAEQHQEAFADDLVLRVAEQAFGGRVQRQDAAGQSSVTAPSLARSSMA